MVNLNIHQWMPSSMANGPGVRAVLWLQGCSIRCPGCFNPLTHSKEGGTKLSVETLFTQITALGNAIEGITVSGGEPLQQRKPLLSLLQRLKADTPLSILLFSGYTLKEIQNMPDTDTLLACLDILIAGRYDKTQHLAHDLRGSINKTIHFLTERYILADFETISPGEIIISPEGDILISGISVLTINPEG